MPGDFTRNCKFFQRRNDQWLECHNEYAIGTSSNGDITLRDTITNKLQIDLPLKSIHKWEKVSRTMLRFKTTGHCIYAFGFRNVDDIEEFSSFLISKGSKVELLDEENSEKYLPDLKDANAQRYMVELLLQSDFPHFVGLVESLFGNFEELVEGKL